MKAQTALEYVFLIGGAMLFIVLVFMVTRTNLLGSAENEIDLTSQEVEEFLDYIPQAPNGSAVPSDFFEVSPPAQPPTPVELLDCEMADGDYWADDVRYVLTRNIAFDGSGTSSSCITLQGTNVELDCTGHTISNGAAGSYGVRAQIGDSMTIRGCTIEGFNVDVSVVNVDNSYVISNTLNSFSLAGIDVTGGTNARVEGNAIDGGGSGNEGIFVDGNNQMDLISNTVQNVPTCSSIDNTPDLTATGNQFSGCTNAGAGIGFLIKSGATNAELLVNTITASDIGVQCDTCTGLRLLANDISTNAFGIKFWKADSAWVQANALTDNTQFGVYLDAVGLTNDNWFQDNDLTGYGNCAFYLCGDVTGGCNENDCPSDIQGCTNNTVMGNNNDPMFCRRGNP
ncbi:right-handed parallel beta-helix repeat-containing protein [Candidatus Micrarchaeota archaeon]|nr:right-handed parallel beta-helix repeat-containing protein [Candidatus Micrarchaeota archaeon]